jgi:hypothetical protein
MRKALLAVALVGASFAGGAAVNGPGLRWALDLVGGGPAEDGSIPVLDDELKKTRLDDPPAQANPPAPKPPARDEDEEEPRSAAARPPEPTETAATVTPGFQEPPDPSPVPGPIEVPAPPPPVAPVSEPVPAPEGDRATDRDRVQGEAPGPPPAPLTLPKPEPVAPAADPAVAPARLDPAVTPAVHQPEPPAPLVSPDGDTGHPWADLVRRMKQLGVGRYVIEGEPDGPVRFRCTVPLPGQRAVAQQFEAEGDDVLTAAEAALKRVTLWKATETP